MRTEVGGAAQAGKWQGTDFPRPSEEQALQQPGMDLLAPGL